MYNANDVEYFKSSFKQIWLKKTCYLSNTKCTRRGVETVKQYVKYIKKVFQFSSSNVILFYFSLLGTQTNTKKSTLIYT